MSTIVRKLNDFKPLKFSIDLSKYGKTEADISDIFFSVKNIETDSDDALLLKTKAIGGITITGSTKIIAEIEWLESDYSNTPVGSYIIGLFVKFTGDPNADENVNKTFNLDIVQDFIIDN